MDCKSFIEKILFLFKRVPSYEEYLSNEDTPEGVEHVYDMSRASLGDLPWMSGYTKNYEEGIDPEFRTSLPWDQDGFDAQNITQIPGEYLKLTKPAGVHTKDALLYSNFSMKHGTVRALVKMPKVKGAFSAFWLFDGLPELDILEHCGQWKRKYACTHHWGYDYGEDYGKKSTLHNTRFNFKLNFNSDWYVLEAEVSPYKVVYKINGVKVRSVKRGVPSGELHIILNVGYGEYCNSKEGVIEDADLLVKWVKTYTKN